MATSPHRGHLQCARRQGDLPLPRAVAIRPVTHAAQRRLRSKTRVEVPIVEGDGQGLVGDSPDTGKF